MVMRSTRPWERCYLVNNVAHVAQLAERVLGKDEVTSSILVVGSRVFAMRSHGWVERYQGWSCAMQRVSVARRE